MGFPPSPRLLRKLREQARCGREVRGQRSEVRCQRSGGQRSDAESPFSMRLLLFGRWAVASGSVSHSRLEVYELEAGSERRLLLISDL